MEDLNKPILDQIIREGFPQMGDLDYKFTAFSLNSDFSFKFDNLQHFITFLKQKAPISEEHSTLIKTALKDLNLQLDSYFFINFHKPQKPELS